MNNSSLYMNGDNIGGTLVFKALVVNVPDDTTGYSPIRCRIPTIDSTLKDNELPKCYPLLPKHLNIYPNIGEYVYILNLNSNSTQQIRYFLGPVIDTFKNLENNPEDNSEINSAIKSDLTQPERGIYPKRKYISIQGRNNSDIIFRDQELIIRAGKFQNKNPLKFNYLDTAYIQVKYGQPELKETIKKIKKNEVKLFSPDGFVIATISNNQPNIWKTNIIIEDNTNKYLGEINNTRFTRNGSISLIKETFINLQKNDPKTIKLILDKNNKNLITNQYDFSKFKYINDSIEELKDFDITPKTEKFTHEDSVDQTETVYNESKGSVINHVANKINLISHANKEGFKLLDPDQNITPEEQLRINTESHPIPYGDLLNDFLNLVKTFVANHVHAYPGLPPVQDPVVRKLLNYELQSILNENVKTA